MTGAEIKSIGSSSPAKKFLSAGDIILEVNNKPLRDILEFIYYSYPQKVKLKFLRQNTKKIINIKKEEGLSLGITFEDAIFDSIKRCRNKCVFCFVDQLPKGLRRSLYIKDDDYRLSFLGGNFVTLTNLAEADWRKIIKFKLSPLYISVHAVRAKIRKKLFGTSASADIVSKLERLKKNNIKFHSQVVLCHGINDGKVLEETVENLTGFYPALLSIGIVPVGKTKYCKNKDIKIFSRKEALKICGMVEKYQKMFFKKYKKRLIYAADEFFLMAGLDIPEADYYEEYPQLENGIGMVRNFLDEFEEGLEKLKNKKFKKKCYLVTGVLFGKILEDLMRKLKCHGIKVVKVKSGFFGKGVTVTGLLTASDIINALKKIKIYGLAPRIFIPDVCLNKDNKFLDDVSIDEIKKIYPRIEVIGGRAKELFKYLKADAAI